MLYKVLIPAVNARRKLVPYDDTFYGEHIKPRIGPMFESIYLYEDRHKELLDKTGSLAGIRDVVTDKVVFDFDHRDNPDLALVDARTLVARLMEVFGENKNVIRCFFSGNKGYHIEVHFDKEYITRTEFESIIFTFAGDLATFDPSVRDEQRVFRLPLSKHEETKAYKLPILFDLFTDAQYKHEAYVNESSKKLDEEYKSVLSSFGVVAIPAQFKNLKPIVADKAPVVVTEINDFPDMELKPKHLTPAKYVLSMGFFESGESHQASMILGATLKFTNFTKDQAYSMIKIAINRRNSRLGADKMDDAAKSDLWKDLSSIYSNTWRGATFSDSTDPLLIKTIKNYKLERFYSTITSDVISITDMGDKFCKFANEIDNCTIKIGVDEIDDNLLLTSSMMVGILGSPSAGKTALSLNTLEYQSVNDISAFMISADMSNHLLFASLMRRHCKMGFKEILNAVKNVKYAFWPKELRDAWDFVMDSFKNVGFNFSSGPSIADIKNKIEEHEQKTGRAVKFLVVDYLEKLTCNYADPTAASGYNAARLADLTRDRDLTTFLLLQTQKASGDPSHELLSMRNIKGASVIEQDCRVVMTLWRPGFNPDVKGINADDKYTSIAVVKNNMGNTGRYDLSFDGGGLYRSLNDEELLDFERVKQDTINRRMAKVNGGGGFQRSGPQAPPAPIRFLPKGQTVAKKEIY